MKIGILAMEFAAPSSGEVIVQLSREPSGPLVAGGKPTSFDWDDHEHRARLTIPAGSGPTAHVRIGLAIEPPDATGYFDSARVLMIGETNRLTAQYSSDDIAQRSRLRTSPGLTASAVPGETPLTMAFDITVPDTAIHGDHADLAIEADGIQVSHSRPQLLRPASLAFPEQIDVHLAANSALPLHPATIPVNQRSGRDVTVSIRNNAAEIRNFTLELKAEGLELLTRKAGRFGRCLDRPRSLFPRLHPRRRAGRAQRRGETLRSGIVHRRDSLPRDSTERRGRVRVGWLLNPRKPEDPRRLLRRNPRRPLAGVDR